MATSWPYRRPFVHWWKYRLYLFVSVHTSIVDSTLHLADANYGRRQYGTHFVRAGGHTVKSCSWTSLEFIRTRSYEISLWHICNYSRKTSQFTKCWGDVLTRGMMSDVLILGTLKQGITPQQCILCISFHVHTCTHTRAFERTWLSNLCFFFSKSIL